MHSSIVNFLGIIGIQFSVMVFGATVEMYNERTSPEVEIFFLFRRFQIGKQIPSKDHLQRISCNPTWVPFHRQKVARNPNLLRNTISEMEFQANW